MGAATSREESRIQNDLAALRLCFKESVDDPLDFDDELSVSAHSVINTMQNSLYHLACDLQEFQRAHPVDAWYARVLRQLPNELVVPQVKWCACRYAHICHGEQLSVESFRCARNMVDTGASFPGRGVLLFRSCPCQPLSQRDRLHDMSIHVLVALFALEGVQYSVEARRKHPFSFFNLLWRAVCEYGSQFVPFVRELCHWVC